MIDYGLTTGITKAPERADIAEWVAQAKDQLTEQIVRNSWRHGAYTFFPPTYEENLVAAALMVVAVAVAIVATVAVAMTNN
jgi:hypothetical protein